MMMWKRNDFVLLLTACVNPRGMIYTALQSSEIRRKQYELALSFYLENTAFPIVFVENSNCNFSYLYKKYIDSGRLEFLSFEGNDYNQSKGKGYGEALIIQHAYNHSKFLQKSKYVIKITGRLIVSNINEILSSKLLRKDNVFRCDFRWNDYLWSMFLVAPVDFLKESINTNIDRIDDSNHVYFEHIVYESLLLNKSMNVIPFFVSPSIVGICGTSNHSYSELLSKEQLSDNLRLAARLQRKRGYLVLGLLYYFSFLLLKVKHFAFSSIK